MKQFAFSICAFFSVSAFAQTSLTGYVTLQNSGGRSAFPATVAASDASATQVDRDKGFFNLVFDDKKRGQDIQLEVVLKGYEVVNYEDLVQLLSGTGPMQRPLKLYLSPVGQLQRNSAAYKVVNLKAIANAHEVKLAESIKQSKSGSAGAGNLEILTSQLAQDRKIAESYAPYISQMLAKANLDDATDRFLQAHHLFTEGKTDSVLMVLEEEKMKASLAALDKYVTEREDLKVAEARKRIVDEFMVKARAHIIKLEFANAERTFHLAVHADSSAAKNWSEYAGFLAVQGKLDAAQPIYEHCLRVQRTNIDLATTLGFLALLHKDRNDLPQAENAHLRLLEIQERLAKDDPEAYEAELANTLNDLGLLYQEKNDFPQAEKSFLRALEIRERLAKETPRTYESTVASTLNNLGLLYQDKDDFPRAEKTFLRALEIYERLTKENPEAYEPDFAITLNYLGILFAEKNDFQQSQESFLRSLEIRERLAKENPSTYESDMVEALYNLASIYRKNSDFAKAETNYIRALEILKRSAKVNPMTYEPDVALTLNILGNLYSDKTEFAKAETSYLGALEIRERLARENPRIYEPDLAGTLNNLAILFTDMNDFSRAKTSYMRALEIYERLARQDPRTYRPDLARTLNNLGILYRSMNDLPEAETWYLRALEIRERLARDNPTVFEPSLASTLYGLGNLYLDMNELSKAGKSHLRGAEIRERLAKENPKAINSDLCRTYVSLSFYCLKMLKSTNEEKWREQGIEWLQKATETLNIYPDDFGPRIELVQRIRNNGNELKDYEAALAVYQKQISEQEAKIGAIKKDGDKVPAQTALVVLYETAYKELPAKEYVAINLANAYGNLSWYALFSQDFSLAEASAQKAIQTHPSADWVHTNLALALLYQGKYEAAKAIYEARRGKPYQNNGTWTEVFLTDLDALEKEGITHPDVAKVRDLLKK